jgi:hypothetical protein
MARTVYYVVDHEGQWKIKLGDKHHGPYATQEKAIRAAVDAAQTEGKRNPDGAQVMVQSTTQNQWRAEWTYGKDPYPPPG